MKILFAYREYYFIPFLALPPSACLNDIVGLIIIHWNAFLPTIWNEIFNIAIIHTIMSFVQDDRRLLKRGERSSDLTILPLSSSKKINTSQEMWE